LEGGSALAELIGCGSIKGKIPFEASPDPRAGSAPDLHDYTTRIDVEKATE
jgi:hypothetical protein